MAKILIIDDTPLIVDMAKEVLLNEKYEVITASDGVEGLAIARETSPDLIILDVMLPRLNGYEICRMLKFDEKYKDIPIIMFTSKSSEENKLMGEECGADDYIIKDFGSDQLVNLVKKYIKMR